MKSFVGAKAMDQTVVTRAWRDPLFRRSLPLSLLAEMPSHPAGELAEETDWIARLGSLEAGGLEITFGGGCTTPGCTAIVCTDPCGSVGPSCNTNTSADGCTLGTGC